MRYAIYFTPPHDSPLARAAAAWLGRDAFTNAAARPPTAGAMSPADIAYHTAAARRYGFHATLKAPFRLNAENNESALISALDTFTAGLQPFTLPPLQISRLDGFLALTPAEKCPRLDQFAGEVVTRFESFRAPLSDAEIGRRNPARLSPRQLKNLHLWGYPYVFEDFRFHMTLTGRLTAHETPELEQAATAHFGAFVDAPLEIGSIALFTEPEPGAPFSVRSFHRLGQKETA